MERFGFESQVGVVVLLAIALVSMMLFTLFTLLPVKMAAAMLSARRTGFVFCAIALFLSFGIYAASLTVPLVGPMVAFFLNGLSFSIVLGTGFIRGLLISLLHGFFAALLAIGLGLILIALGVISREAVGKKLEGEIVYSTPPPIISIYSSAA